MSSACPLPCTQLANRALKCKRLIFRLMGHAEMRRGTIRCKPYMVPEKSTRVSTYGSLRIVRKITQCLGDGSGGASANATVYVFLSDLFMPVRGCRHHGIDV
jgi:hypothetical protein